jgi:hypothetical protein
VTYQPSTPFAMVRDDPEALAIVERHAPGILQEPDARLQPFTSVADLVARVRGVGEPPVDRTRLWDELAALDRADAPAAAPSPWPNRHIDTGIMPKLIRVSDHPERWGLVEIILAGPSSGNPFLDVALTATFRQDGNMITVGGFYDGSGVFRIRFLPPTAGSWSYQTSSNAPALDGASGTFEVSSASSGNHGRVMVRDRYHFGYDDGSAYLPLGTTAYAWTHQPVDLQDQTLLTLSGTGFTKIRMCLFPKSFVYNTREPELFPFERSGDGVWDFARFSVPYFRALERRIQQLQQLGIEADLILFHPYDRWGFSQLPPWADHLYTQYVVRRLAGFRNVWWSLANEYDFMPSKSVADWEGIADVISCEDHADHLVSIHNGAVLYDYARPWITHCSIQRNNTEQTSTNVDAWRRFGKPVVVDEAGYEGDLPWGWGSLTPQELVHRAWDGAVRGGYVNHGETYHSDEEIVWWSHGGTLHGQSADRFAFLRQIISQTPTGRFEPLTSDFDLPCGGDDDHRIVYFGTARPISRPFRLPAGTWEIDVIDTWAMTVTTLSEPVTGAVSVPLPGRSYVAVRFRRRANEL